MRVEDSRDDEEEERMAFPDSCYDDDDIEFYKSSTSPGCLTKDRRFHITSMGSQQKRTTQSWKRVE